MPEESLSTNVEVLAQQVEALRHETKGVRDAVHDRVRWGQIAVAALAFATVVSLIFGGVAYSASRKANDVAQTQKINSAVELHTRCETSNNSRADIRAGLLANVEYVDGTLQVFNIDPTAAEPPPGTSADQKVLFNRLIANRVKVLSKINSPNLAERDCDKLFPLPKGVIEAPAPPPTPPTSTTTTVPTTTTAA